MHLLVVLLTAGFIHVASSGWVKEMENPGLYEGDMVLTPDQMKEVKTGKYQFGAIKDKLWPNGIIPYQISYDLARESEFISEFQVSLAEYHKYTCLKFIKRTNERHYIDFKKGGGCSSPVGRSNYGANRVSLGKGCWWRSTIMHEIGHSLGFHHEQSRPDRDNYVKILSYNIYQGMDFNFEKEKQADIDSRNTPYDYRSMMHYSWNAFGKNQAMTIKTLDPTQQYEIGQDEGFSHLDILQLNRMYNCPTNLPTLPPYVPPPAGCYDLGSCAKGAHKGHCTQPSWKSYMHSKCRRSCKLCGNTGPVSSGKPVTYPPYTQPQKTDKPTQGPGGNCKDRVVDCWKLGRHRCTDSITVWREYMQRSCKKYCKLC